MKKIRILVDGHVLDGKHQGTSSYISGLYTEVSKRSECEVFVATEKKESIEKYFAGNENINWIPLKSNNKYQRLAVEFDRIAKDIKPDFSHFQYITPLIKRNKWVNTIHDLLFLDFAENFPLSYRIKNHSLFRLSALRSDILLTVSDYSKKRISDLFRLPESKLTVTPNAIDDISDVLSKEVDNLLNEKFYLYVSRFEKRKNQHLLIESFIDSKAYLSSKLVLVGAPALPYPELEYYLNNDEYKDKILHFQGIEKSELVWLYRNAIASIYPSLGEGFGIPPLEAVALQCPSFCADNTALSELAPFVSGTFSNNKKSITNLINEIEQTVFNPDTLLKKQREVVSNFNWEKCADILLEELKNNM